MAQPLLRRASYYSLSPLATKRLFLLTQPSSSSSSSSHPPPSTLYSTSPWLARSYSVAAPGATMFETMAPRARVGFLSLWPNYRSRIVHSHGRRLLGIMQQRMWDAALEYELAHAGVFLRPYIVDQVIGCIPSAKLALQFFIWAGEQIGYPDLTSQATHDIVQWYQSKAQLFPFLMVLKGLEGHHFHLSPSRINVLIQGYGWAGMLDRAFEVMLRTNSFSNDMLVKCFFFSIMKQYNYDMVYYVYMEMKKQGTCLDLCYNELIQGMALADGERWHEADLLFKQMADTGHILKEQTCNALILAISTAGQHERAYELLQDMMKMKIRLANATVSAVIQSLCHAKELHKASRVIGEMKQHGFVVDSKIFNSLLEAIGDQGGSENESGC